MRPLPILILILSSALSAAAQQNYPCVGDFKSDGADTNYKVHFSAYVHSSHDVCDGGFTVTCTDCPNGYGISIPPGCSNGCSWDADVSCWPAGTYTAQWHGWCRDGIFPYCYPNTTPVDNATTFTVPQRSANASLDYDSDNHRLVITYGFSTPHLGKIQVYQDGNDDDANPDGIISVTLPSPQSGVLYYGLGEPICFQPHQYKVKIRDCDTDPWTPSNKVPVAAATLGCPVDYNNTNCKQKDDWSADCPVNNDNCPGAPVNIGSGDVSVDVPLFTIAQSPMPVSFELTYHSLAPSHPDAVSTTISSGWTHNFNASLRPTDPVHEPGRLLLVTAHGQRYYFDEVNSSLWIAVKPAGATDEVNLSGSEYVWKRVDGSEMHFDSATGRWSSSRDRWGNAISGGYNTDGLLTTVTDSMGRAITLTYQSGVLNTIQLPTSETWTLGYSNGNLSSITDPISPSPWRTFTYQPDSHNVVRLLTAVRDAGNAILEQHDYDASDRGVTSVADGGRDAYTIEYDTPSLGRVTITHNVDAMTTRVSTISLLKQNGQYLPTEVDGVCPSCGGASTTQAYTFDKHDQAITRVDGIGITTTYAYDGYGNVISKIEGAGSSAPRQTTYAYGDPTWPTLLTQEIDPPAVSGSGGLITTNSWSPVNHTMTTTQSGYLTSAGPRTSYTTVSAFDSRHRLLSIDGPRTDVSDVTSYGYFADADSTASLRGRLHTITNALNQTTTFEDYDGFGTARKSTDPNGVVTLRTTDARGRTTAVTNQAVPADPNESTDYQTTYMFDSRDRLTDVVSPRGLHTRYGYEDGTNRLTDTTLLDLDGNEKDRRHIAYDLTGQKTLEQDQTCSSPASHCTNWTSKRDESYVYDSNARLVEIDHGGAKILYGYDADGRITSVQDENHSAPNMTYAYDVFDRVTTVTQTLNGQQNGATTITTLYAYDTQDNLTSVTDPNGNVTTYAYDDFHRLQGQSSPVTGATTYSYDPSGNLTSSTDANGATTLRTYDALNRATSAVSGSGATETVSWSYDTGAYGVGRLATMTDPTGSTAYGYERRGLLKSTQQTLGGALYTTSFTYDKNANRTSITYPTGTVVSYTYDFAERPFSVAWPWINIVGAATYLPFGPMTTLVYGNGTTKTMSYDNRYRLTENKLTGPIGTTIADYAYTTDAVGNITQIHDVVDSTYDRTFGYDDLNRLITANTGTALWQSGSYSYDAMGNLLSRSLGRTPPDDGTILSVPHPHRATPFGVSGQVDSLSFQYQGTTPKISIVTSGGLDHSVVYDAAGNELSTFVTRSYSNRNLMTTVSDTSSESPHSLTYGYDGRGVRVSRTEAPTPNGTASRYYVYSPELQLLEITDDDSANIWSQKARTFSNPLPESHNFVWFGGQPVGEWGPARTADSVELSRRPPASVLSATTLLFTFTDHLGTPLLQMSTIGDVVWRAEYEPYGNTWSMRKGSRGDQPLRLPGQEVAMTWEGTDENYNIFRWYRAGWGRYTQADPIGLRGGLNLLGYADDNPEVFSDRTGLVVVRNHGIKVFHGTLDEVVMACHGLNVKGCVLGRSDRIHCACQCANGFYQAHVTMDTEYNVYYATNTPVPGDLIRAAELQHVADQEAFDEVSLHEAEALETWTFLTKWLCETGCAALKFNDSTRRLKYLLWDITKGHNEAGAH